MQRSVKALLVCGAVIAGGLGAAAPAAVATTTSAPTLVTTYLACSSGVCQVGPGNVGVAFSAALVGTGGTPGTQQCPYYITVTGLPPGLQNGNPPCGGAIAGTPTKAGTYTVTATITPGDNESGQQAGPSGTQQLTITIGTGSSDRLVLNGTVDGQVRLNMECGDSEPIMTFYAADANYGATYTVTETSTGKQLDTFTGTTESQLGDYILFDVPYSTAITFPSGTTSEGSITVTDTAGGSATLPVRRETGC
jgi:hypothetical protein